MAQYNPDSPCTIGAQWRPQRASVGILDTDAKAIGMILDASTSDTVRDFYMFVRALLGIDATLSIEVYDLTTSGGIVPQPGLTVDQYLPNADIWNAPAPNIVGVLGPFSGESLTTAYPAWMALDSTTLTPYTAGNGATYDNNEYVANFYGAGYDFAVQFDGVDGSMAGRWITRVTSWARVAQYYGYATPPGNVIQPYLWHNGRRSFGASETIVAAQGIREVVFDWFADPHTGLPWTPGAFDRFDSNTHFREYGLGWVSLPTGSSNNVTAILQAQLHVESAGSDPRLVIGATGTLRSPGWHAATFVDPATATAADLTLTPGDRYLFVIRRSTGGARVSLGRLRDPKQPLPGPPSWASSTPSLDVVTRRVSRVGPFDDDAYGVALVSSGGAVSLDSQPYATVSPLDGLDSFPELNEYFQVSQVDVGASMRQEFTAPATAAYGWLTLVAGTVAEGADGPLVIQVRDSGGTAVGGPFTIDATDIGTPTHGWHQIGVRAPGATLALTSGTQYYFDVTSTASPERGWLVQVMNSLVGVPPYGPPAGSDVANVGGVVDRLKVGTPLAYQDGMDAVLSISTLPATPTGVTAVALAETCGIAPIRVSWDQAPLPSCSTFASYEVQRRDTPTGPWLTIARITDRAVTSALDFESIRNQPADYRTRVWRGDGVPSDWSTPVTATAPMSRVGMVFASNVAVDLIVFYQDTGQERTWDLPVNDDVFEPRGRNYAIVLTEAEDRGRRIKRRLRVRAGVDVCLPACDPDGMGTDVFGPLRALTHATIPYVCVHTETGDRVFARVKVTAGQHTQHGNEADGGSGIYTADIDIIEVTDTPAPFDAQAAS